MTETRFAFGENWSKYAQLVDEERIAAATTSLTSMLGVEGLRGRSFLDIGCGSGLFSVAAARLGARVHAFDYDPDSVATTRRMVDAFAPDADIRVEQGDALDRDYVSSLGTHDVVYSWGVLHHTGALWRAMDNAARCVRPGGLLFIALYNHQIFWSTYWTVVKRAYCRSPRPVQAILYGAYTVQQTLRGLVVDVLRGRDPRARYRVGPRGMSIQRDRLDWLGGYPFETVRPVQVRQWAQGQDLDEVRAELVGRRLGCNQFVFRRRH